MALGCNPSTVLYSPLPARKHSITRSMTVSLSTSVSSVNVPEEFPAQSPRMDICAKPKQDSRNMSGRFTICVNSVTITQHYYVGVRTLSDRDVNAILRQMGAVDQVAADSVATSHTLN
jgi:hypothetical protein